MGPQQDRKITPRFGIIGGGASGLSAAYYLKQAGYDDVIVFEKQRRVGGKCHSVEVDGRSYEMGAVLGTRDYSATLQLMKAVGLKGGPMDDSACYDPHGRRIGMYAWYQLPRLLWLLMGRYNWLTHVRYRQVNEPGLAAIHPDLHAPFEVFAQRHGFPALGQVLTPPFTAFGYGYFGEIPAAYVMKYLDMPTIQALRDCKRRMIWPDGIEALWTRLAAQLDVRTGAEVCRVTRRDKVLVETTRDAFEFDKLILACPLDEALALLDATRIEHQLFSAIRTYDYWVLLCEIDGLPPGSGYIPAHFTREKQGHVMLWYHRWPDKPLYTLYALGDLALDEEAVERLSAADLNAMGATLRKVVLAQRWKYFPHVSTAEMEAGYYRKLEGIQGANNTYFAGEVMSFATVEICARYAKSLVDRFFAPSSRHLTWNVPAVDKAIRL